jgi:hypothetical protein
MKMYGGMDIQFHVLLTSVVDEGKCLALVPGKEPPVPIP